MASSWVSALITQKMYGGLLPALLSSAQLSFTTNFERFIGKHSVASGGNELNVGMVGKASL